MKDATTYKLSTPMPDMRLVTVRKLYHVSGSKALVVTIPRSIVKEWGLKAGDEVLVSVSDEERIIMLKPLEKTREG